MQLALRQSRALLYRGERFLLQPIHLFLEVSEELFVLLAEEVDLLEVRIFVDECALVPNVFV